LRRQAFVGSGKRDLRARRQPIAHPTNALSPVPQRLIDAAADQIVVFNQQESHDRDRSGGGIISAACNSYVNSELTQRGA
jgi:phospholipase/lecithinase/hemolysin